MGITNGDLFDKLEKIDAKVEKLEGSLASVHEEVAVMNEKGNGCRAGMKDKFKYVWGALTILFGFISTLSYYTFVRTPPMHLTKPVASPVSAIRIESMKDGSLPDSLVGDEDKRHSHLGTLRPYPTSESN